MATPAKTLTHRLESLAPNPAGHLPSRMPAHGHKAASPRLKKAPATILVVEDHPLLLKLVVEILEHVHYKVLAANSPKEALGIESTFKGTIDLLLSDIMMPEMNGPDLAKLLKEQRPKMRVILMSAYPGGAMLVLNYGWHFIQKPFLTEALLARVKHVLKSKTREQGTDHFDTGK